MENADGQQASGEVERKHAGLAPGARITWSPLQQSNVPNRRPHPNAALLDLG